MESTIFREPTAEEKRDFIVIGQKDYKYKFNEKNTAKQQEYTIKHKPYCFRCAKMDFEDKIDLILKEASRGNLGDDKAFKVEDADLNKYADPKRFNLIKTSPAMDRPRGNYTNLQIQTGIMEHYVCKERGCKIVVEVPNEELEKREGKKAK